MSKLAGSIRELQEEEKARKEAAEAERRAKEHLAQKVTIFWRRSFDDFALAISAANKDFEAAGETNRFSCDPMPSEEENEHAVLHLRHYYEGGSPVSETCIECAENGQVHITLTVRNSPVRGTHAVLDLDQEGWEAILNAIYRIDVGLDTPMTFK